MLSMICDALIVYAFSVACAYSDAVTAYGYVTENKLLVNTSFACWPIVVC